MPVYMGGGVGATGATGATGAAGATGATGSAGATGAAGTDGSGNITLPAWLFTTSIQGTWARGIGTDQYLNSALHNITGAANNDEVNYNVYFTAGTYTLVCVHGTGNGKGILKFKDGTTTLATIDEYTAGNVESVVTTITGIVIAASGLVTLRVMCDGKNASSSGYIIFLNCFSFQRTA